MNNETIYQYPTGTFIAVDINEINTDIDKIKMLGLDDNFESVTSLHNYFLDMYVDVNGKELITYDDISRFLRRKKGSVGGEKAVMIAEELGLILRNDEAYYMTYVSDALEVMKYNKLTDINNYVDTMDTLEDVLLGFRDILLSIEDSEHFNFIPNTEIDGYDFYNEWIKEIDRAIFKLTIKDQVLRSKLLNILEEVEVFIRSYEIPGVVLRWQRLNPKIQYFDVAYTLMNDEPEIYKRLKNGNQNIKLSIYPSEENLRLRNEYFNNIEAENQRKNFQYSEMRIFNNELERTLNLVIENDLKDYLI